MAYNCYETSRANSTILKVILVDEGRSRMLLTFGQFLGHKLLNFRSKLHGTKAIWNLTHTTTELGQRRTKTRSLGSVLGG